MALTARERQILLLIDEGLSNKEIAARLSIEVATVKNHVHSLLTKMQVNTRGQAAARLGWPPASPAPSAPGSRTRASSSRRRGNSSPPLRTRKTPSCQQARAGLFLRVLSVLRGGEVLRDPDPELDPLVLAL